jgi:hypothetical protein
VPDIDRDHGHERAETGVEPALLGQPKGPQQLIQTAHRGAEHQQPQHADNHRGDHCWPNQHVSGEVVQHDRTVDQQG